MDPGGLHQTFFHAKMALNVRLTHDDLESARAPNYYVSSHFSHSANSLASPTFHPSSTRSSNTSSLMRSRRPAGLTSGFLTTRSLFVGMTSLINLPRNIPIGVLYDL